MITHLAQSGAGIAGFSVLVSFFGFILALIWIIFPFTVSRGIAKQREANRQIVTLLTEIRDQLAANKAAMEASRANENYLVQGTQWLIENQSAKQQQEQPPASVSKAEPPATS